MTLYFVIKLVFCLVQNVEDFYVTHVQIAVDLYKISFQFL